MTLLSSIRRHIMRQLGAGAEVTVHQTELVPADGVTYTVFEQGAGPALLLLHAGSSDWTAWQLVASRLRRRFRVLAFDRRPYASSKDRVASASMATEVDDVVAAARFAGERVVLVGHSSGAVVALEAALRCPSVFRGLVLYEPPVAVSVASRRRGLAARTDGTGRRGAGAGDGDTLPGDREGTTLSSAPPATPAATQATDEQVCIQPDCG
jgi:pimeloyl-ACP methyl ester carboxylesterase